MALHTELPIYRTGVRLLDLAVKAQVQMPRTVKRALGEKITQHCVEILDLMALANASQRDVRAGHIDQLLTRQRAAPRTWTPQEDDQLRTHYPHQYTRQLAADMGLSLEYVYRRAATLGLRKSDAYLTTDKSGRIFRGGKLGVKTQFTTGQKPWNTGRKGWQAGGRSVHTQFSTGMAPPNTLPVGSHRIVTEKSGEKHLEQKVRDVPGPNHKRWTPVTRLVWEATHGPVPKGSIIVFKSGMRTLDAQHITLDRVECITRAQHAARNHPNSKSPELARLYQLKGAITRQVNRIKNQTSTQTESCTA